MFYIRIVIILSFEVVASMDHQIPGLMVNTEGYVTKAANGAGPAISYPTPAPVAAAPVAAASAAPAAASYSSYGQQYQQQQQPSYQAPAPSYTKPPAYGGGYGAAAAAPAPRADTNQNIVPINAINPYSSRYGVFVILLLS